MADLVTRICRWIVRRGQPAVPPIDAGRFSAMVAQGIVEAYPSLHAEADAAGSDAHTPPPGATGLDRVAARPAARGSIPDPGVMG